MIPVREENNKAEFKAVSQIYSGMPEAGSFFKNDSEYAKHKKTAKPARAGLGIPAGCNWAYISMITFNKIVNADEAPAKFLIDFGSAKAVWDFRGGEAVLFIAK